MLKEFCDGAYRVHYSCGKIVKIETTIQADGTIGVIKDIKPGDAEYAAYKARIETCSGGGL